MALVFCCTADNDIYRRVADLDTETIRVDSVNTAIASACDNQGVLILADNYPIATSHLSAESLALARRKNLRLYIEFPATLGQLTLPAPTLAHWERLVIASDFLSPALPPMTILAQHGCWYQPIDAQQSHIVVARVAGYRTACYGLPDTAAPILYGASPGMLVATTKLSQCITARYAPSIAWQNLWQRLLCWLDPTLSHTITWTPTVRPTFSASATLSESAERTAFTRSNRWFREHVTVSVDEKKYTLEGFESTIDHLGRQFQRNMLRADCIAEGAMVHAFNFALTTDPDSRRLATAMLDSIFNERDFVCTDPTHPTFGLVNWDRRNPVFYGDDNARVILPALAAARLLADNRWNQAIVRCILANFRTTGTLGFRRDRFDDPISFADGKNWQHYWSEEFVYASPHFEAYLWACNLWLYAMTHHEPLLERTRTALAKTMDIYPKLRWTNGLTQEIARLLLPLAFLIRVDDTPQNRDWLKRVSADLLRLMQPCGAIRETLGSPETGQFPPPASNENYGTHEASLIQNDGDPACDLLYSTNYAFLGLHEAAAVTRDATLLAAEDKLAEFLCRIQLTSESMPRLSGCWMRSFDYDLWEYFGSSADAGWGAWCVESGWTNTWIASVLAMRSMRTSLFDLSLADNINAIFPRIHAELFQKHT